MSFDFYLKKRATKISTDIVSKYQRWIIARNGFWFIDIPKTSTTSIRHELGKKHGLIYAKTNNILSFKPHKTSVYMLDFMGSKTWGNLFSFTFVRNPWDRSLSYFLWAKSKGHFPELDFRSFVYEIDKQFRTGHSSQFNWYGPYASCSDYLYSHDGTLMVKFVGKYENRKNDIEKIQEKINALQSKSSMKFSGRTLGKLMSNSNIMYNRKNFYDSELIEIISCVYHNDIKNFNYDSSDFF